ncbi:MAG: co-chaperone DjlA [Arenicellales bacterium]
MVIPYLKPVLAVLGYVYFGFFGGILGWLGGGFASAVLRDGVKALSPGGRVEIQADRQALFLKTLFLLMGKLAKADSKVSQAEIDHVEQFMRQMSMTGEHRKQAIDYFQQGMKPEFTLDAALNEFLAVGGHSHQMKHLLLVYLSGVALADGELHADEQALLQSIAATLGYSAAAFQRLMAMIQAQNQFRGQGGAQTGGAYQQQGQQQYGQAPRGATNTLAEAYQALGVSSDNTDKEIKRAYRKLISQYHPDKLIGQGVPEDMIAKATERSKEIHSAYELIERHRKAL